MARNIPILVIVWIDESWQVFAISAILAVKFSGSEYVAHGARAWGHALCRRPSAEVPITLEGRTLHTVSLFGQDGDMEVLGAYTLEAFGLAVSPVLRRFIPF